MSTPASKVRDWPDAPEGTTHALLRPGSAIVWLKLGEPISPAFWWRRQNWVEDVENSGRWLSDPCVVPKVPTDSA